MPPLYGANGGTGLEERYDRWMEDWIPLMVALVAAATSVGVASWSSRGESAELRQIKAMSEEIPELEPNSRGARALVAARDRLLVRVAVRVLTAPVRRARARSIALITVSFAGFYLSVLTMSRSLPEGWEQAITLALSILSAIVVSIVAFKFGHLIGFQHAAADIDKKSIDAEIRRWSDTPVDES